MIGNEKVHNKDFELEPEGKKIYFSVLIYFSKLKSLRNWKIFCKWNDEKF